MKTTKTLLLSAAAMTALAIGAHAENTMTGDTAPEKMDKTMAADVSASTAPDVSPNHHMKKKHASHTSARTGKTKDSSAPVVGRSGDPSSTMGE